MTLSGFALLWFILALGCIVAGTILTRRSAARSSSSARVVRRPEDRPAVSAEQARATCARCTQLQEPGARFCGSCGLFLHQHQAKRDLHTYIHTYAPAQTGLRWRRK
ncbi:MAG TPA: hypothetical protein VGD98_00055 [Ktedonobacteraceae bacterium]